MNKQQVVIKKILSAPIEKVFNAWVDPLAMQKWYSPEGITTPHAETDLRVGGSYAVTMTHVDEIPPRTVVVRGIYKEITRPTKLQFSWQWDGQEEVTEVKVELRALTDKQTELTLTHSGFENREYKKGYAKEDHKNGWTTAFNKLDSLLKGGE
jgi:uncharacterized protein YndB with AHSA1/START domain